MNRQQRRAQARRKGPGMTHADVLARTEGKGLTLLWHSMAGTIVYVMAEQDDEGKLDRLDGWPWCGEGGK